MPKHPVSSKGVLQVFLTCSKLYISSLRLVDLNNYLEILRLVDLNNYLNIAYMLKISWPK